MSEPQKVVGAIILAAGQSRRMGRPKLVLPWGDKTVIENVVNELLSAGISQIIVVTGGSNDLVEANLRSYPVRVVFNPDYSSGEMMESLKIGLQNAPEGWDACLIVLGDQPQIRSVVVCDLLNEYFSTCAGIILPSFRMKRGHPWLVGKEYWPELLEYRSPQSLRDFLSSHAQSIRYVNVDDVSVMLDLDTPEDYESQRPQS